MATPAAEKTDNKTTPSAESIVETPKLEASGGILMYRENKPENPPQTDKKINELKKFCEEVEIILLTINENEYHAAALFMKKPSDSFERAVFYPKPNMVVGMFAMKKTALIQSDVGINSTPFIKEAINFFPNALYVIGVGVCYAFNPNCKFGDVLVSKQICDLRNAKFKKNGKIENRGQTIDILSDLKFFCMDLDHEYEVASPSRLSKVYTGPFVSYSALIDNKVMRNKIHKAVPGAIGGEMEGGELLDFERKRRIKGIVVIKGVVDYADGTKSKEWQFVSAMAAMNYTESKLLRVRTLRDESTFQRISSTPSPSKRGGATAGHATKTKPAKQSKQGYSSNKEGCFKKPECKCGMLARRLETKKEGPNKGRWFFGCPKPREEQCNFFVWEDTIRKRKPPTCSTCSQVGHTKRKCPPQ